MHVSDQCLPGPTRTPQCCFAPFFSRNQILSPNNQRNANDLLIFSKKHQSILDQRQIIFAHLKSTPSNHNSKRSISSLKATRIAVNRNTYTTENNTPSHKIQLNRQKQKKSLRGSQIVQRYFSPKAHQNSKVGISQKDARMRNQPYFVHQSNVNKTKFQQEKSYTSVKQQKIMGPIQFSKFISRHYTQNYASIPVNHTKFKTQKINNNQRINMTGIKFDIPSTATNLGNSERFRDKEKPQQVIVINKTVPIPIRNDINEQNLKSFNDQESNASQNNIIRQRKTSLERALQGEINQQNKPQTKMLETPINPFKYIESFVMKIEKQKGITNQQKQYESIKTKGRATESMLQYTKDMTRTKKVRKQGKRPSQACLHDLQSVQVTSEYDEEAKQRVQRIEESVIFHNFFNPSKDLRERLQLSKHNRPFIGKSGFY